MEFVAQRGLPGWPAPERDARCALAERYDVARMDPILAPRRFASWRSDVDLLFAGLLLASSLVLGLLFFLAGPVLRPLSRFQSGRSRRPDTQKLALGGELDAAASFLCFLALFVWGAVIYFQIYRRRRPDELSVFVVLPSSGCGRSSTRAANPKSMLLHIPVNRPIRLVMASQDVIHSFFIPALRLKHDVVPGRYQDLEITAQRTGHYHLFCAEYCGTKHSGMTGEIVVMESADYAAWLTQQAPSSSLAR